MKNHPKGINFRGNLFSQIRNFAQKIRIDFRGFSGFYPGTYFCGWKEIEHFADSFSKFTSFVTEIDVL